MLNLNKTILALALFLGLFLAGQQISKGGTRFRAETRTITVKGLAEQEVRSDQASWSLGFRRASDSLETAQRTIAQDKNLLRRFLLDQGFSPDDISSSPFRMIDKLANEYNSDEKGPRYILSGDIRVTTADVDRIASALNNLDSLQQSGILLDLEGVGANPSYRISRFADELRPQLLQAATINARQTAEHMANNLGAKVGKVRSANQGVIQILSAGNTDDYDYSSDAALVKKLRVVSTFEFDLQ